MTHRQGGFAELRVVSTARWLADDLAGGTDLPVVHDLGLDAPADTTSTAWWAPHRFVSRLAVTPGATRPLLRSPGPDWMSTVDPAFTRRKVWTGQLRDAHRSGLWDTAEPVDGLRVFAKAAEVKIGRLPARGYMTAGGFVGAAERAGLLPTSPVVLSELVAFTQEYRCFIAPRADGAPRVVAASAYLLAGTTWDFWDDASQAPDPSDAAAFAQQVAAVTAGPAGFVLDVGRLADGSWAVVEANASWSSNPYHADPAGVVSSILAAQDPAGDPGWAWRSDPFLDRFAQPLPVRTA